MLITYNDETRTVTTTADDGTITHRPYTSDENAAADHQAEAQAHANIEARLKALEAAVFKPEPEPEPADTSSVPLWPGIIPAGGIYRETDGTIWRNTTSVPLTEPISRFPGTREQWAHLWQQVTTTVTPPVSTYPEWSATADYKTGDRVTRAGVTYECLVPHGAAYGGTWGPPTTGVWKQI